MVAPHYKIKITNKIIKNLQNYETIICKQHNFFIMINYLKIADLLKSCSKS